MSNIQLFDHPSFGSLTTFSDEDGEKYFKANDICIALRLSNPSQQLTRHVKEKWKKVIDDGLSNSGSALYVSKPGLYALIFRSKTPQADIFQDWVFEEVLPKLDAEGGYIMPSATVEQLKSLQNQIVNQRSIIDGWEQHLDRVEIESRRIGSLIEKKHGMSNHAVLAAQVDLYGWCHFAIQHKEKARIVAEAFRSEKLGSWQSVAHLKGIFERATGGYVGVRILAAWLIEWGFDVRSYDCNTYSLEVRCNKLYGPNAKKIEISISIPKSDRKIQWVSAGSPPVQIASTEGN